MHGSIPLNEPHFAVFQKFGTIVPDDGSVGNSMQPPTTVSCMLSHRRRTCEVWLIEIYSGRRVPRHDLSESGQRRCNHRLEWTKPNRLPWACRPIP